MSPGQSIAIQQSAVVQEKLANVNGSDLLQANILESPYNTPTAANALAKNINKCMTIIKPALIHTAPAFSTTHGEHSLSPNLAGTPGVWFRPEGSAADLVQLGSLKEKLCWQTSFKDGQISYRDLSHEEAETLRAELRASLPAGSSSLGWLSDFGDFLAGVINGVINILTMLVETVENGVHVVIHFLVNGAEDLIDTVITTVGQAFDIVEILFADVDVTFKKLLAWLGFVFNWKQIVYTQQAMEYTVSQLLQFLPLAAQGVQKVVDGGFSKLKGQISTLFSDAIKSVGQSSVGGYAEDNKPSFPAFGSASANNILGNALIDNIGGATLLPSESLTADAELLESVNSFLAELNIFVGSVEQNKAFPGITTYFQNLGTSTDQIFVSLLTGLLTAVEGIAEQVVAGMQTFADTLLQMTTKLLDFLATLLTRSWQIPFVSQLYTYITGESSFTALGLMTLIAAIPTTILYKVVEGVAPFPDPDSVKDFQNSFNYESMLQAAGFAQIEGALPLPAKVATTLMQLNACCVGILGVFTAKLDIQPSASDLPSEGTLGTTILVAVLEIAAQALSFPWFTSPTSVQAAVSWSWGWVGILLDIVFLIKDQKFPENDSDLGVGAELLYAIVHFIMAIVLAIVSDKGLQRAAAILPTIPELSKVLRLTAIEEFTDGISLGVLAVEDVIFYTATAYVLARLSNSAQE
jgi:hypothetical protein